MSTGIGPLVIATADVEGCVPTSAVFETSGIACGTVEQGGRGIGFTIELETGGTGGTAAVFKGSSDGVPPASVATIANVLADALFKAAAVVREDITCFGRLIPSCDANDANWDTSLVASSSSLSIATGAKLTFPLMD